MPAPIHRLALIDQGDGVSVSIESKIEAPSGNLRSLLTAELDSAMLRAVRDLAGKYLNDRNIEAIYWKDGHAPVRTREIDPDENVNKVADDLRKAGFSVHIAAR